MSYSKKILTASAWILVDNLFVFMVGPNKKGDKLFTIYSDSAHKLAEAEKVAQTEPIGVRASWSDTMLIDKVEATEERHETRFVLDRG